MPAGVLGYFWPEKPWRWGLTVMLVQALTLAFAASSFGLMLFAVLALPAILVARRAAGFRLRSSRS